MPSVLDEWKWRRVVCWVILHINRAKGASFHAKIVGCSSFVVGHNCLKRRKLCSMSRKTNASFTPIHAQALQTGFKEHGWDPTEKEGKKINATIKGTPQVFEILKPLFSKKDGGTKENNNSIYGHYKTQGSEYIVSLALEGVRAVELERKQCVVLFNTPLSLSNRFPLFTGKYLQESGVSGVRKREFNEEDLDDDEDDWGSQAEEDNIYNDEMPPAFSPRAGRGAGRGAASVVNFPKATPSAYGERRV